MSRIFDLDASFEHRFYEITETTEYNDNGRDNGGIDIRQTFDMGSDKQSADQCRESASDGSFPGFLGEIRGNNLCFPNFEPNK